MVSDPTPHKSTERRAHSQPVRALGTEPQTFEAETDTGGTVALIIRLFITFLEATRSVDERLSHGLLRRQDLSAYSARVAARLSAHCTLGFWRSGSLSSGRSWGSGLGGLWYGRH
jgi:hypothetical protein